MQNIQGYSGKTWSTVFDVVFSNDRIRWCGEVRIEGEKRNKDLQHIQDPLLYSTKSITLMLPESCVEKLLLSFVLSLCRTFSWTAGI